MSSEEDYASSNGGGGSGGSDDDDDHHEEEPTAVVAKKKPTTRRGAITPRGSPSRRNPRRYTTADIDEEIAMNKDHDDDDDDDDENNNNNNNDNEGSSSDGDSEEENRAAERLKAAKSKKQEQGNQHSSPARRSGYKQPSKTKAASSKKKGAAKKGGKATATGRTKKAAKKKDGFIADSDDDASDAEEEEVVSSEDNPEEESGEEWDQNASDANGDSDAAADGDSDSDSDSDFGAPKRKTKRGGGNTNKKKKATPKAGKEKKGRAAKKNASTANSTPTRSTRATRATRSTTYQEEEDHPSSSDSEEIQYETTPSGSRRPRRQCKARTQAKMHEVVQADMQSEKEALGDMLEEDDKELLENSDHGEGDPSSGGEEFATRGRGAKGRAKSSKKGNSVGVSPKKPKYDEDESYDEDAAPSENENAEDDDMSDYEEESDVPQRRSARTSSREKSTKKATYYKDVDESEEEIGTADEDSDDEATGPSILMSPVRKTSSAVGSYGSPSARQRARARMGREPLDVKEQGDSESESSYEDVEFAGGKKGKRKKKKKPKKKRRRLSAGSPGSDNDESDYEGGSDEGASSDEEGGQKLQHVLLKSPYSQSPTKLKSTHIHCPSTIDDITMTNLPTNKPHVCYISPDGRTRHCFTLDTLYRIAISKSSNETEIANALSETSTQKLKFLQPPHFRSEMGDDLLDQIASRFGRGALVIEKSAIYKKIRGTSFRSGMDDELDEFDEDGEYIGHDMQNGGARGPTNFNERFERYMQNLMGSTDVYCCPLCYNEADRRLGNADEEMWEDDEDGDENGEDNGAGEDRFSFLDDPLTILGSLDHEQFETASTFCFRLLSGVKTHLKVLHGINIKDIEGNDLFKRFQIRASDGLLQSWLRKSLRQNTVQGDMMRYWLNGENQSFVLLLNQIDKMKASRDDDGDEEEQPAGGEYGSDFSVSFPNRAHRIWRDVSSPFLKAQHDMGDFIAEEGDDDEELEEDGVEDAAAVAAGVPVNPNFTPPDGKGGDDFKSPEEQMIEHLQLKTRRRKQYDSDSDSSSEASDKGDDDASSELEVLPKPQEYEEVEEEDNWTKSKRLKAKKKNEESDDDNVFDSDAEKSPNPQILNGRARKIDDDGNDDLDSDEEEEKADSKTPAKNGGSARKRVLESSDEE